MSAAKKASVRARGLVLVRGGLKAEDGGGEDDWEDFCRRIGWQTPAPEPSEDFEERIREGLSAKAAEIDNVIDLDLQREIRRSLVRDFDSLPENEAPISGVHDVDPAALREFRAACLADASGDRGVSDPEEGLSDTDAPVIDEAAEAGPAPDIESDRRRRLGWERVGVATLTLALAAAVLLAVMKLTVFSSSPPNGGLSAGIERDATSGPRAVAPSRIDSPLPQVVAPVRTAPPQGPTATPAPSPRSPRDAKPVPPGAVIARRSRGNARETPDVATGPVETNGDVAEPPGYTLASSAGSPAWPAVASDAVPAAPWGAAYRPRSAGDRLLDVAPSTPRVAALDNIASPSHASTDVLSNTPPSADSAALDRTPAPAASLGLAGASNRWIGASLPSSPPAFAAANIGVMVQLDLGRAFNNL